MLKISPSRARGSGSIPGWGAKIHMPRGQKNKNKSNFVPNSIKTLKWSTSKNVIKKENLQVYRIKKIIKPRHILVIHIQLCISRSTAIIWKFKSHTCTNPKFHGSSPKTNKADSAWNGRHCSNTQDSQVLSLWLKVPQKGADESHHNFLFSLSQPEHFPLGTAT